MLRAMLMAPIMQVMAFGYAANTDVKHVPIVVVDQDRSFREPRSRGSVHGPPGYFDVVGSEDTTSTVEPWLIRRKADLALVIAPDFGGDLVVVAAPACNFADKASTELQAVVGLGYANRILAVAVPKPPAADAGATALLHGRSRSSSSCRAPGSTWT
ncbi:MAG: hypothetical protein U0610_08700 [bacterium]